MISIKNFKVNSFERPVGLADPTPKFSWVIESDEQNVKQDGYRIELTEWGEWAPEFFWDSGYIESDETYNIPYTGMFLEKDTKYFVKLTVKINGKDYIYNTDFRTGLIDTRPTCVCWICPDTESGVYKYSPYFRKSFNAENKKVEFATLYIACRGWYSLSINGTKPDKNEVLSPVTNVSSRKCYMQSYDVTDMISGGENVIGVMLGNGYSQQFRNGTSYIGGKRIWAFLSVVYSDGTYTHVFSDDTWKWAKSPIIFDHIYDGEWYDAGRELDGWDKPGFCDATWRNCGFSRYFDDILPLDSEPVRILGTRKCVGINKLSDTVSVYDFKYNGSGVLKIKVKGEKGAQIKMRHAENLHPDGTLQTWTNRNAEATDIYTLKGEGEEIYTPTFTYHCFRYAEITVIGNAEVLDAEALVYGADIFNNSSFECSSDMLNRIQRNFVRTLKTNFMSWPCDTGVRDERTPCAMDTIVYEEMAIHNCDIRNYFIRWYYNSLSYAGSPGWAGNSIVLGWLLWKYYGETDLLSKTYSHLRSLGASFYGEYEKGKFSLAFGDWSAPNPTNDYEDSFSSSVETMYGMWVIEAEMLSEIADALGHKCDAARFKADADFARKVFIEEYYDKNTHLFSNGKQTPNLLALSGNVLPENEAEMALNALIKSIRQKDNSHLDTGIFGTRKLIEVLSKTKDGLELVYDILHQTTYPSFGHQIVGRDATTAWEQWYNLQGMMTCSHSMFVGIGVDFYKVFAGIKNKENSYKKAEIKPLIPEKLTGVNCKLDTPRGVYSVVWNKQDGKFTLSVTVPANCSADIEMPDGTVTSVTSGSYDFTCEI